MSVHGRPRGPQSTDQGDGVPLALVALVQRGNINGFARSLKAEVVSACQHHLPVSIQRCDGVVDVDVNGTRSLVT